jgi:hypothetical protein
LADCLLMVQHDLRDQLPVAIHLRPPDEIADGDACSFRDLFENNRREVVTSAIVDAGEPFWIDRLHRHQRGDPDDCRRGE